MAIEYLVLNYLLGSIDVPVYMEEPQNPEERYILLEKTGSGIENHICEATFAIQSYGATMEQAIDLNEDVKAVMDIYAEQSDDVFRCKRNSDYNFTDTETNRYRYQAVYDIIY